MKAISFLFKEEKIISFTLEEKKEEFLFVFLLIFVDFCCCSRGKGGATAPTTAATPPRGGTEPTSSSSSSSSSTKEDSQAGSAFLGFVFRCLLFVYFGYSAVTIRLFAVINYGRVIHEFDPWFNYRATEYLVKHGYSEFVDWYDYESWYVFFFFFCFFFGFEKKKKCQSNFEIFNFV